jgi:ribonucleotide reductase beta subunit family protein with ferritin-like domain
LDQKLDKAQVHEIIMSATEIEIDFARDVLQRDGVNIVPGLAFEDMRMHIKQVANSVSRMLGYTDIYSKQEARQLGYVKMIDVENKANQFELDSNSYFKVSTTNGGLKRIKI